MLKVRKIRKAVEQELELGDDDIIETHEVAPAKSGIHRAASVPDDDAEANDVPTGVNELAGDLAKIVVPSSTPRLRAAVEWNELGQHEAWLVSMVTSGMTVEAILATSPLDDDATLRVLAKLVDERVIKLA